MIKSVVRSFYWNWQHVETLFLDDQDFKGLEYWYNDVAATDEEIRS